MTDPVLGHHARPFVRLIMLALLAWFAVPAAAQDAGEIRVRVIQYGLGNLARAGDWMGVQVEILDSAPSERDIILRLQIRDADGDRAMFDRVVTANPGVEQSFWLYARLPFQAAQDPPTVTVFEAIETGTDNGAVQAGYRAGRILGRSPPGSQASGLILPPSVGAAAVIGPYPAGMDQYGISVQGRAWAPFGHELTRVATGLDIPRLPDRWQGLAPLDTLVWAESTTRSTEPMALTPERAAALRAWIERGGHLVIILPPAGEPWFAGEHALSPILPDIRRPTRREGYDLSRARALLTESADLQLPTSAVLHTFTPSPDADPRHAQRVLDLPDGGTVVIRRVVGAGAVTVVGLDLTSGPLRRFGLPEADRFWHRVLGRRGVIKPQERMTDQERADAAMARREMDFDHDIASAVARTGSAVQGVLFGIAVFISYWLVAGPVGFMLLRRRGLHHHAWVAFVVCTALFTGLAWAGATALRPKRVSYTHLTLLEMVDGQPIARARTWSSVMLPTYGQSTVSVRSPDQGSAQRTGGAGDLLTPWEPPGNLAGWSKGFPDNSGYRVDARSPDTLTVPTRATIKQFRADLAGRSQWGGIRLVRDPGDLNEPVIGREGLRLSGSIEHDLPGALTDVLIFISPGQSRILPEGSGLAGGAVSSVMVLAPQFADRAWPAGQALDLGAVSAAGVGQARMPDYFRAAVRDGIDTGSLTGVAAGAALPTRLTAVRFLSQFAPPNFRDDRDTVANRLGRRMDTHGWDLGRWLTTPCVIVTGFVEVPARAASEDGAPFPLYVDGRAAPASGLTMVTWIYPLGDEPPRWPEPGDGAAAAPPGGSEGG
ncbi:MAG: hypothetical protein LAT64_05910 [Phycisphaerales bacterium]|nr:hypothetical protein [Phycisphaerales bacterium]